MTANALALVWACVLGVGPILLIAVLQNRRDRRAAELFHEVASQLSAEALRSDVAVDVRARLLWRGATVRLDLGRASSAHIWETATRLRGALPVWVRLEVDGRVDGPQAMPRPVRITVESPEPETLRRAA
jgi:hypothetical protein